MSQNESKVSGAQLAIFAVLGVALMVGGMAMSKSIGPGAPNEPEFLKSLGEQGILLDPGKTIAVIGVFLIVFKLVHIFYISPLMEAIHARNSQLENTFAEAENLRSEMTKMRSDYEARLVETEAAARAQIQDEIKKAQDLRTQMQAEVALQREQMIARAQEEINTERARVVGELRLKTVDLTMSATEKLIGQRLDPEADRKLIEEFIEKAEVPVA